MLGGKEKLSLFSPKATSVCKKIHSKGTKTKVLELIGEITLGYKINI